MGTRRHTTIGPTQPGPTTAGRSASSVVEPGGSWGEIFHRVGGPCHEAERRYVQAVLERYLWLPVTPMRSGRQDRRCARALYGRRIPLAVVEAALLLAAVRRTFRPKDAAALSPIRGLHYFLPVIDELLAQAPVPGYVEYLIGKLRPLADAKQRLASTGSSCSDPFTAEGREEGRRGSCQRQSPRGVDRRLLPAFQELER